MTPTEPINLQEWKGSAGAQQSGRLFTCGRPGRATYDTKILSGPDDIIDLWANGLPKAEALHIVSLLGRKRSGYSEFGYYPFRSAKEPGTKPTFQSWLDARYGPRFVVHEFPTVDREGIPKDALGLAGDCVLRLLRAGHTTVVMDSAGCERTARVCEAIKYTSTSAGT